MPLPVFYHTFCTLGAFRLRETSYRELKPCKLQWFLHLRVGPLAFSKIGRKSIGKSPQNKTKQNAALSTLLRICRILFCFVLLAREGGRPAGWGMDCKSQKVHENSPRESWEALDHAILHRISARIQPRRRHFAKPLILESHFFRFSDLFLYIFSCLGSPAGVIILKLCRYGQL